MKELTRYLKKGWIFLGFFFVGMNVFGQESIEELYELVNENKRDTNEVIALNKLYKLQSKTEPEKAKECLDKALALAQELDYKKGQGFSYHYYGSYYDFRGDYDKSRQMYHKSRNCFTAVEHYIGVAGNMTGLGNVEIIQGNYPEAMAYYLTAADIYEKVESKVGEAQSYHNVGNVHFSLGQNDQALDFFQRSLSIREILGDSASIVRGMNAVSAVYIAQEKYDKALDKLKQTLRVAKQVSNSHDIAILNNNIGVIYKETNELDSAKFYYADALNIYRHLNQQSEIGMIYNNLGGIESELQNGNRAIAYYDSSLTINQQIGTLPMLILSYRGLSDAYRINGDYKEAYEWHVKYHALDDSLAGEDVKNQINELQTKYETSQKDKEIAELEKREVEANAIAERRKIMLISGSVIGIAFIMVILFYVSRRRAKEQRNKAEMEQKILRAQMNPHFIFNSLGAIQQLYITGELDMANDYMGDFGKLMRKILDNSGKEKITIKEEMSMLRLYLDLEKGRNIGMLEYQIDLDDRIDKLGTKVPPMVIQPFVENAIWHGILPKKEKGLVKVRMRIQDNARHLICEIEDNGVGIDNVVKSSTHESKGMKITEQRLGTKVKVQSLSPGTLVTVKVPI